MKSIGTDIRATHETACAGRVHRRRAHPRGVAEIELMLVIILILLPLLFLIGGAWTIGRTRLRAAYDAENGAYAQVVSGEGVMEYSDDPIPPAGVLNLPNRFASERVYGTVPLFYGSMGTNNVAYSERAIFLDPSWHYSPYPYSAAGDADHAVIAAWFENYVGESKTPEIVQSLGLQPAGPP
jgi:hypothetical protein